MSTPFFKGFHNLAIVDDGVFYVDRRTEFLERLFHNGNRPVNPGAKPPWSGKNHFHGTFWLVRIFIQVCLS